jgi:hypothetical protein
MGDALKSAGVVYVSYGPNSRSDQRHKPADPKRAQMVILEISQRSPANHAAWSESACESTPMAKELTWISQNFSYQASANAGFARVAARKATSASTVRSVDTRT